MARFGQVAATVAMVFCYPATARSSDVGPTVAALREWDIVVAADAIASEVYAARELQTLVERLFWQ